MTLQEINELRELCEKLGEDRTRAQLAEGWWRTPEERSIASEWLLRRERLSRDEELTRQRARDERMLSAAERSTSAAERAARWAAIAAFLSLVALFIEKIVLRVWQPP